MYDLTVVIATHNRPVFIIESINSVLNQINKEFKFIVSDNSDDYKTFLEIEKNNLLEKLEYKKRSSNSAMEHFNMILNEIETKYFILFHDDDIMLSNMTLKLYEKIKEDNSLIAVGCNSYILKNNNILKTSMLREKEDIVLRNQTDLVIKYCDNYNIVPFPSYIYNLEIIKDANIKFNNFAGKHSDVIWLLDLIKVGDIKWLKEPLMLYRKHNMQDSSEYSSKDMRILINTCSQILINGRNNEFLRKYRTRNLYIEIKKRIKYKKRISKFIFKQVKYLFSSFSFELFVKINIIIIIEYFNKIKNKIIYLSTR
jgi:glycosyltransferase involved in cell wall biosynthesis